MVAQVLNVLGRRRYNYYIAFVSSEYDYISYIFHILDREEGLRHVSDRSNHGSDNELAIAIVEVEGT